VTNDDKITKLNAIDGTTVATNDLPLGASCAPTASDGIVYIVTDLGHLSLVDGSTLQTMQTLYKYGNQQVLHCVDTPLVAFGTVIVQSHQNGYSGDANLVAFR
jgi:outer membrane protein assembly factor BamB